MNTRHWMAAAACAALLAACGGVSPPPVPGGERIPVNWDVGTSVPSASKQEGEAAGGDLEKTPGELAFEADKAEGGR